MSMRSARYLAAVLGSFAILLAACGQQPAGGGTASPSAGAKAAYGGTLTFALENDPANLDPMLSGLFVDRNIHYAMYDSLVRVDPKGNIIPWLAEKWETSSDGKTVTFTLRTDVKFHDGTSFDADAVKWNIERYKTTQGSLRTGDLSSVDTVTVVDPKTVKLNLKSAFAPLLGAVGADFTLKPFKAGTGPFILTEAVKNDHYTLEKNPDWWGKDANQNKLPYLDKVTVKIITDADVRLTNLRTGNVQLVNLINGKDVPAVKADTTLNYQEVGSIAMRS